MSTIANLTVALNADVAGFSGTMASATRSINQFRRMGQQVFESTRTPLERYHAGLQRLGALYHGAQIDVETYRRAIERLNNELRESQELNNRPARVAQPSRIGEHLAGGILGFSTGVGASILVINEVMSAIRSLGDAMVDAGVSALKLAAEFETAEITFTTLFKSASAAKQVMAEIKQFAATTPFEFPQLKDAGAKLAGFGISAKQVVPTLKMLGDIAAGTGTSINELAETYGKARITGRAYTRDVMELANRNVPIWEALNKVLGTTNAETHKLVEDGKVGFRELQQAILSLVQDGGQFQGAMEDRAKGIEGLVSNLKDNITIAFGDLGEAMIRELNLKEVASQLIDLTGVFQTDGIPVLIEFGKGLTILGTAGNETLKMLTGMDLSIKGITETIYGAHAAILQWQLANAKLFGSQEQVLEIQKQIVDLAVRAAGLKGGAAPPGAVELEPGGNQTGIDKEIAALELQAQMVGKSATEKKLAALATKGLLEADQEYVAELVKKIEEDKAGEKASEKARKTAEEHIKALTAQANAFGRTAASVDLYKQKLAGANDEELRQMRLQHNRIAQQEYDRKQTQKDGERMEKLTGKFKALEDATRTPAEALRKSLEDIDKLEKQGGFGATKSQRETLDRARLNAAEEFFARDRTNAGNTNNPALIAGTSSFYSAINKTLANNASPEKKLEDKLKRILEADKRREQIQRQQLDVLKKQQVANF